MMPERRSLSLTLAAASVNAIAQTQNPSGAGNLTLNGALVSGGVATLSPAQRIGIYSAGNDSALTFTITGLGLNGLAQTELLAGANIGTAISLLEWSSIPNIAVSGDAGSLTVGTVERGSTTPNICQEAENYSVAVVADATVDWQIEVCYDDYSPAWNLNRNDITWFPFTAADLINNRGKIPGPVTMMRLTILKGAGTARLVILTHLLTGKV